MAEDCHMTNLKLKKNVKIIFCAIPPRNTQYSVGLFEVSKALPAFPSHKSIENPRLTQQVPSVRPGPSHILLQIVTKCVCVRAQRYMYRKSPAEIRTPTH